MNFTKRFGGRALLLGTLAAALMVSAPAWGGDDPFNPEGSSSIPFWTIDVTPSSSSERVAPVNVTLEVEDPGTAYTPLKNIQWDVDGDGVVDAITGTNRKLEWTYREASSGTGWSVEVWAIDKNGTKQHTKATVRVLAPESPPTITSFTADKTEGETALVVNFTVEAAATAPGATISQYNWDTNGDGRVDVVTEVGSLRKVFVKAFTGNVKVWARDSIGVEASKTVAVDFTQGENPGGEIESPSAGDKVAGKIPVSATSTAVTESVSMSYRAKGAETWTTIGPASGLAGSWVVQWDTTGLPQGAYELKADFTGLAGTLEGPTVEVEVVEPANADSYSYEDDDGYPVARKKPNPNGPTIITLPDGTTLVFPALAFSGDTDTAALIARLTRKLTASESSGLGARQRQRVGSGTTGVNLSVDGGSLALSKPFELRIPINDSETSQIPEANLGVFDTDGNEVEPNPFASAFASDNPLVATDGVGENKRYLTGTSDIFGTYTVAEAGPDVEISTDKSSYMTGDAMTVKVSLGGDHVIDLYIGVFDPNGNLIATLPAPNTLSGGIAPIVTGFQTSSLKDITLFQLDALPELTTGTWSWKIVAFSADGDNVGSLIGQHTATWSFGEEASPTSPFGAGER